MSYVSPTAPGAMPNQTPPDTKGMTVKQTIKAEVDHALDVIVHNPSIPWLSPFAKVTAALNRVVAIIDASGRESFGVVRTESAELEARRAAAQWRERAEKAEADYKSLFQNHRVLEETITRLKAELLKKDEGDRSEGRALEKARVVIEAMLEHFKPVTPSPLFGDEGADPTAFDADGVAYGAKLGIGELRYGDLEVASGAIVACGAMSQVTRG